MDSSKVVSLLFVIANVALLGLYAWGMIRTVRQKTGIPPWPLRLVADAKGSPRFGFIYVLLMVSVATLVFVFATTPTRAQRREAQLDRIEQLLREIRDEVRR